jgi:hypothetical protein
MDIEKYIGFRFETLKPLLDKSNIDYSLVEVWDTKKTKMGNDLRIIKVDNSNNLTIYVSYF